jgi:hypothetical protein
VTIKALAMIRLKTLSRRPLGCPSTQGPASQPRSADPITA